MATAAGRRRDAAEQITIPPGPRLGSLVVEVERLTKSVGARMLFRNVSFTLPRNGIVGVIGPNGVGKTTLFHLISGRDAPDGGTIRIGDSVRIAYVDQARSGLDPDRTAWELISGGHEVLHIGAVEVPSRAHAAAFGFKGAEQQKPARLFSGGERNRINLALTLRQGGNVLLLDEPTNDLDTATLASLEAAIADFAGCVVVTAHHRWFLDRVATHMLAWEGEDSERAQWCWFEGNFAEYQRNRSARLGDDVVVRAPHRRFGRD